MLRPSLINSFVFGFLFLETAGISSAQTSGQPSCVYSYELTNRSTEQTDGIINILVSGGVARTPAINNSNQNCNAYLLQYYSEGFSAISLELDDSQTIYTVGGGSPASWNAWQGTIIQGTNPSTVATSALLVTTGFYPWLSVSLGSSTGTGSIHINLFGWKTPALTAGLAVAALGNITVAANGYIGIGTSTPQSVLDINGQLDLLGVNGIQYPTTDTTANGTIFIGSQAGTFQPASAAYGNVALGYQALGNVGLTTAAINNVAIGFQSLTGNTSGAQSTCIGYQACLQTSTTANTAVGYKALATGNSTSSVAFGNNAMSSGSITNGSAIGTNACSTCTGSGDTGIGVNAGRFISSGARNVAVGQGSIQGITGTRVTGSDNTAVGDSSLLLCQGACASNTVIGSAVGNAITSGTNNILIGMSSTCATGAITNSNETHICGPTADSIKITGNGTVGTEIGTINGVWTIVQTGATATFNVTNSNGNCALTPITSTFSCSSSIQWKKNVKAANSYGRWLQSFQVREYDLKSDNSHHTGIIAEEIQKTHPEMVHVIDNGLKDNKFNGTLSVDAPDPWKLVKVLQEQQSEIEELRLVISILRKHISY